ncbi:MAG: DUF6515 family protein [Opitutaceae bacterium]|jgi:hypothetical protein
MNFANATFLKRMGVGLAGLLVALLAVHAQRQEPARGGGGGQPSREPARTAAPAHPAAPPRAAVPQRPVVVDRASHGSIRHADTHVVQRPVAERPAFEVRRDVVVHHDVDVDVHRARFWNGFAQGRRWAALPLGCISLVVNGAPYYYDDGIYYQPEDGGYAEVYPPVGADVTDLPDGAIAIEAGNLVYYYAGGAFYVQQDSGFVIAPPPIGVTVPELPPGAVQVSVRGAVAYQFNGIYYQPVFVNGVTQFQTFMP